MTVAEQTVHNAYRRAVADTIVDEIFSHHGTFVDIGDEHFIWYQVSDEVDNDSRLGDLPEEEKQQVKFYIMAKLGFEID